MGLEKILIQVIFVVVLATLVASLSDTLYAAVNVSFGPVSATIMLLLAQIALGLVILFSLIQIVKDAQSKKMGF